MLGDVAVRRKAAASETVTQADSFRWTVVFLSKVQYTSSQRFIVVTCTCLCEKTNFSLDPWYCWHGIFTSFAFVRRTQRYWYVPIQYWSIVDFPLQAL